MLRADRLELYADEVLDAVVRFLPKLTLAALALVVGFWLIGWFSRFVRRSLERRDVDLTLRTFIKSAVSIGLKILLIIMVAGMLGVQTSSFVAVIGAMGLAIGLALQGSLSNFAGGFLIILFKPYEVGEFVQLEGYSGVVKEIQIFNTVLLTGDGQLITIPNGQTSNHVTVNFSRYGMRRVDIELPFPIEADVQSIREIILDYVKRDQRVLSEPAPWCVVSKLGPGDLTLTVSLHVKPQDYWQISVDIRESLIVLLHENQMRFDDDAERIVHQTPGA
jgi:small conductance mechanosensitive channel